MVSCVVYASKFKPADIGIDGMRAAPVSNNNGILRENRKPRETTTNAHDWVWLGMFYIILRLIFVIFCDLINFNSFCNINPP